ncbi:IS256 family transposase [Gemmiger formicilis]
MNTVTDFPKKDDGLIDLNSVSRQLLEAMLNAVMDEQASELCAAAGISRNGYRDRSLTTCIGEINLRIPKLREGTYFPEDIVTRWSRTDTALASVIQEMWVNGVSNRKIDVVATELGIEKLSRSRISRLCKALDEEVEILKTCDLSGKTWPYLWLDATYVKCREAGAARSTAIVLAIAVDEFARRQIVGIDCIDTESYVSWRDFLLGLRRRGMTGVKLVTSDDHAGLVRAIHEVMIGAAWQRCIAHFERNVTERVRKKGVGAAAVKALKTAFAEHDPSLVKAGYKRACELLRNHDEAGADLLEDARSDVLTYLDFPQEHRHWIRTNNLCERMNAEFKRRTKAVQIFPSNESLIRLVGAICCEQNDSWATEKNFIDAHSMQDLTIEKDSQPATPEEVDCVIRLVEEIFEKTLRAA